MRYVNWMMMLGILMFNRVRLSGRERGALLGRDASSNAGGGGGGGGGGSALLLEDGSYLLLEDGGKILLES